MISSPGWDKPSAGPPTVSSKLPPVTASTGLVTASPAVVSTPPPTVPPRNGSRLEHTAVTNGKAKLQEKYFDSNIEAEASPPPVQAKASSRSDGEEKSSSDVTDKAGGGGAGGYRENWKARQDKQNTIVFNFTGSKKDVSHIENDGLDLSKRNEKKVGSFKSFHETLFYVSLVFLPVSNSIDSRLLAYPDPVFFSGGHIQ